MKFTNIPENIFQYTGKSLEEILETQRRIEEFRKAMEEQIKINVELLLKKITI